MPRRVSAVHEAVAGVIAIEKSWDVRRKGHWSSGRWPEDAVRAVGPIIRPLGPRSAPSLR